MSLESDLFDLRQALPSLKKLEQVEAALTGAASAERLARAAEARLAAAEAKLSDLNVKIAQASDMHHEVDCSATAKVAKTEADCARLLSEATDSAQRMVRAGEAQANAILEAAERQNDEIQGQIRTNQDVLASLAVQISGEEAKLAALREAIRRITLTSVNEGDA